MPRDRYDEKKLEGIAAHRRNTWHAISAIIKDGRHRECVDSVSDRELEGGARMDAMLDRIEARGEAERADMANQLGILLSNAGRADDFLNSLSDGNFQRELLAEFEPGKSGAKRFAGKSRVQFLK